MIHNILLAYRLRKSFGIGNADPQKRVFPETDHATNFFHEGNAQAFVMIGSKGDSIVGHAESQTHGGVPAVWAGDFGVVDIGERGFHLEQAEACDQFARIGDRHAVAFTHAKRKEQSAPAFVEAVGEVLSFHIFMAPFCSLHLCEFILYCNLT